MRIWDKSITDIPRNQMGKLTSIVTERVTIINMTHTDQLGSILASVKCPVLELWRMDLIDTETRALVTAMRNRVETVGFGGEVTLDMEELTQYDGLGCCSELHVWSDMRTRYGERLRRWKADKGWRGTGESDFEIVMNRK